MADPNTTALELEIRALDAALDAILVAESLDQAQGIAHAARHREEYHGHEERGHDG